MEAPDDFLNAVIWDVVQAKTASDMNSDGILEIGIEKLNVDAETCSFAVERRKFSTQQI